MKLVIYTADCTGDASNCLYPHRIEVTSVAELAEAVSRDHVAAKYANNYRSNDNFEEAAVIEIDCNNDHSDDSTDWVTLEMLAEDDDLGDAEFATTPSRHNMLPKGGKAAKPIFHFHAVIDRCTSPDQIAAMKRALHKKYPFFDGNALDAAEKDDDSSVSPSGGAIFECARNNTMSHFAGRVLKKYGVTDKARDLFLERAGKCNPPLPTSELNAIWKSAIKFAKKVQGEPGYIPPDEYNDEFGTGRLKPEDYSDIGEAWVLVAECTGTPRYTSGTDYLTFGGDRWYEALGMVEGSLDLQLSDSEEAIAVAEDALMALGLSEEIVKGHGKELAKSVPDNKVGLLYALVGALAYQKFVMKYRNY